MPSEPQDESARPHADIWRRFEQAARRKRLGGSYLFVGPVGAAHREFAYDLTQAIFCTERSDSLVPCGHCPACRQSQAGTHPDLEVVSIRPDRTRIVVDDLIGDREQRMRTGLCHNIYLSPMAADRRIAIIEHADTLQDASANCLLKTLEEPPPRAMIILLSHNVQRQLPTIRSRCKVVRFERLHGEQRIAHLVASGQARSRVEAEHLAGQSTAITVDATTAHPEALDAFRREFPSLLDEIHVKVPHARRSAQEFIDKGGKEGPPKRTRMRFAAELAAEHFRGSLRALHTGPDAEPDQQDVDPWREEASAACVERSVDAFIQVDRNVNAATWISAWLDDLGRIVREAARD